MAIIENIFGTKSNLSGTTWPDKWSQCLAIIAPTILSLGLAGCDRSNAAVKLPAGNAQTECESRDRERSAKDGHYCPPACRSIRAVLAGLSGPIRRREPGSAARCSPYGVPKY